MTWNQFVAVFGLGAVFGSLITFLYMTFSWKE